MKRWKKTGRERRRRALQKVGSYWLQRLRRNRRKRQEARHAKAQKRRENRVFDGIVREWTEARHSRTMAEAQAASEVDQNKRRGWRIGKRGWWQPKAGQRLYQARVPF